MAGAGDPIALFVDLGDAFTKVLVVGSSSREPLRFPSVVASRLLAGGKEMSQLLLDTREVLPRIASFDPSDYPRTRSYPRAEDFVRRVRSEPPVDGARFAGRIAATYGADRHLFGLSPTLATVDALVHKALILASGGQSCSAELTFVLDVGTNAEVVERYARACPRSATVQLQSYRDPEPRRIELGFSGRLVDAPSCVAAALPTSLSPAAGGPVLVLDIGFFRTKLMLVSEDGCERLEPVLPMGTSDVVRRILRDGQDQGLIEDEFAVIEALERLDGQLLEVGGRRFDVGAALQSAGRALAEELARAAERALVGYCQRRGHTCKALAIIGGGSPLVGSGVKERLEVAELGLRAIWIAPDPSFFLVEGARRLSQRAPEPS